MLRTDVRQTGNSRSQHAHVHRRRDGRVKTPQPKKKPKTKQKLYSQHTMVLSPLSPATSTTSLETAGGAMHNHCRCSTLWGGKKEPLSSSPCWLNDGTAAAQRFQKPEKNMAKTWVTLGGVYGYSNQTLAAPAFKPARVIFTVLWLYSPHCCFSCQENQTLILQSFDMIGAVFGNLSLVRLCYFLHAHPY